MSRSGSPSLAFACEPMANRGRETSSEARSVPYDVPTLSLYLTFAPDHPRVARGTTTHESLYCRTCDSEWLGQVCTATKARDICRYNGRKLLQESTGRAYGQGTRKEVRSA